MLDCETPVLLILGGKKEWLGGMAFDAWFLWDLSDKIQNKSILVRHAKPAPTKSGAPACTHAG